MDHWEGKFSLCEVFSKTFVRTILNALGSEKGGHTREVSGSLPCFGDSLGRRGFENILQSG
jgi:hypothetical protein